VARRDICVCFSVDQDRTRPQFALASEYRYCAFNVRNVGAKKSAASLEKDEERKDGWQRRRDDADP
jgi:hypothetical protein